MATSRSALRERRAIRKAIRAERRSLEEQRDCGAMGFEVAQRMIYGIDEALRAITRHARGR